MDPNVLEIAASLKLLIGQTAESFDVGSVDEQPNLGRFSNVSEHCGCGWYSFRPYHVFGHHNSCKPSQHTVDMHMST